MSSAAGCALRATARPLPLNGASQVAAVVRLDMGGSSRSARSAEVDVDTRVRVFDLDDTAKVVLDGIPISLQGLV